MHYSLKTTSLYRNLERGKTTQTQKWQHSTHTEGASGKHTEGEKHGSIGLSASVRNRPVDVEILVEVSWVSEMFVPELRKIQEKYTHIQNWPCLSAGTRLQNRLLSVSKFTSCEICVFFTLRIVSTLLSVHGCESKSVLLANKGGLIHLGFLLFHSYR